MKLYNYFSYKQFNIYYMKNIKKFKELFENSEENELIFVPTKTTCPCGDECDCGDDCTCGDDCDCVDCKNGRVIHKD